MITQYCIIRNNTIVLNGTQLFSGEGKALNLFLDEAYAFLKADYPKFYKMDNLSKLGFLAAECLLMNRKLSEEYPSDQVSIVLSNAHSSLDTDLRFLESTQNIASPALFVYTLPNIVAGEICIRHRIKGENAFFVSPSFDPDLLFDYTTMVMTSPIPDSKSGIPEACIAGWVDVMGAQHDVFLYLLEKNKAPLVEHSPANLKELYNTTLWNN